MKTIIIGLSLLMIHATVFAQKKCVPYLDQDGNECVLTWNEESGESKLFYYDLDAKKYIESDYQLSTRPSSDRGKFGMRIFLDPDGVETILTWNKETGLSRLYYHDEVKNKFAMTYSQLPPKPIEANGYYDFVPYKGKDGVESVLVWNVTNGNSKHYILSSTKNKFVESPYQLPSSPAGLHGMFEFAPFIDKDGEESFIVWNTLTGNSKLYHFDTTKNEYLVAASQLPEHHSRTRGGFGIVPYLDKNGDICILTYNSKTGGSLLYYYNNGEEKYMLSPWQLPTKPTGDEGRYEFMPYIDRYGAECILAWNSKTGVSKLYRHVEHENNFSLHSHQMLILH